MAHHPKGQHPYDPAWELKTKYKQQVGGAKTRGHKTLEKARRAFEKGKARERLVGSRARQ